MFKELNTFKIQLKEIFSLIFIFLMMLQKVLTANEHQLSSYYIWLPQFYGKIEGKNKLLYTRSFSRSQLRFIDIDNDGYDELFVGKKDGRIAFFENHGSSTKPIFKLETEDYLVIHESLDKLGKPILQKTVLDIGENAAPEFVDIDGDEDFDLFVGSSDGHIFHYENIGNRLKPIFSRKTPIFMGLKFRGNSVPRFADLNGDKASDLVVGTGSGKINVFFNSGTTEKAIFCPKFQIGNRPDIRCKYQPKIVADIAPSIDAVPEFVDWDKDKDLDLIVGKSNGKLNYYLNNGDRFSPKLVLRSKNFQFIDTGGSASPTFHDINKDNFPELFLGTPSSKVIFYKNKEIMWDKLRKIKKLEIEKIDTSNSVKKILLQACDLLNGFPDCIVLLSSAFDVPKEIKLSKIEEILPYIFKPDISMNQNIENFQMNESESESSDGLKKTEILENKKNKISTSKKNINRNQLWLASQNYLNIENLGGNILYSSISSGDWNKDGILDILLGSKSGEIFAFENRSQYGTDWYQITFPALRKNNREFSYPFLVDIDGDSDLDIISGNKMGKLEWILNQGTQTKPDWVIHDLNLSQIDVGSFSAPLLLDMDKDEDLDLIVGNGKGFIIYYENNGNKNSPKYTLRSTRLTGIQVSGNSAPSFLNWHDNKHRDLVVGSREGFLNLITHMPPENSQVFRGWELQSTKWQNIRNIGFSTPHFADFDNDNKTDFLLGDKQGNLLFWKNGGVKILENSEDKNTLIITENSLEVEDGKNEETINNIEPVKPVTEDEPPINEPIKPKFEFVSDKFGNLEVGHRAFPAFFDVDGDNNLDLIVGNKEGELRYYKRNKKSIDAKWTLKTNFFLNYDGGKNSAPVFSDLDGDGDLDLLVGNQQGSIQFWENIGDYNIAEFVYNPSPFLGVTGGKNSVPTVIDLNKDGLNDILVGNLLGQIYKYNHIKKNNRYGFRLERRKYLNLDVGLGSVPTIADINNDDQPELIVGSDSGRLHSFQIDSEKVDYIVWKKFSGYFKDLKLPVGGNPVFVDLDNDGDLDLVIGSEAGTLHYFRNTGY